nr:hypothetical protein [Alcaligenes sp. HPC1271]
MSPATPTAMGQVVLNRSAQAQNPAVARPAAVVVSSTQAGLNRPLLESLGPVSSSMN